MQFWITRTSQRGRKARQEAPCDGATPLDVTYKNISGRTISERAWTVEIASLDELLAFRDDYGDLVLTAGDADDDPMIEIYDDYRE